VEARPRAGRRDRFLPGRALPAGRIRGRPKGQAVHPLAVPGVHRGSLFGWYTTEGASPLPHAYVETAKGSGKTPFGAGLMLYLLVADGERGAQVYCAAVTKDQAKLAFTDAENMVQISPI
jgi:hypothetical protein